MSILSTFSSHSLFLLITAAHERLATISSITTYSTAITIHWTTMNNRLPRTPLSLTALQIKVIDGEQYKLNYTAMNIITGAFCMGELEKDTLYEVCLHPTFNVNGMVETESVCMFAMTRAVDNENVVSILDQCAKPVKRTSQVSCKYPLFLSLSALCISSIFKRFLFCLCSSLSCCFP